MKKIIGLLVFASLALSSFVPVTVSAQASVADNLTKIQTLMSQIKALQDQIKALQQQQVQLQSTTSQTVLEIVQSLRQGSEGDQVKVLQTLLSLDSALYPEGLVTGYYGPATRRAIERFQRKHGLEAVGFVGPRTRAELNKLIREQFKVVEDLEDEIDDDVAEDIERAIASITLPPLPSDPCAVPGLPFATTTPFIQKDGKTKIIQTGNVFIYKDGKHKIIITPNTYHEKDGKKKLIITPGMRIEKDGKFKSIIPCNGTTTPPTTGNDTTAPIISAIQSNPTHQSATVTWITNEVATGKIYYGTTTPLNTSTSSVLSSSSLQTGHTFNLTGLSANTTYYFVLESKDGKGNTATSSQQSFTTTNTPDTSAPTITAISVTGISTSTATVSWTTNENANSKVYYGTTTPLNTGVALTKVDGTLLTSHSLQLTGLNPSATYYFKVESTDSSSNTSLGSETSFTTNALPVDATPPIISLVSVSPASTTAQINWSTNEAGTSKIYYGTTTPLVLGSASTISDNTLVTSHSLGLSSLATSTTYYYVIESKDAANNTGTSSESSFVTGN